MFGLGMPEILLILAIALIVIGPKKLPELAKTLGRAMGEFKRSAQDLKRSIDLETPIKDIKESASDLNTPIQDAQPFSTDKEAKAQKDPDLDKPPSETPAENDTSYGENKTDIDNTQTATKTGPKETKAE